MFLNVSEAKANQCLGRLHSNLGIPALHCKPKRCPGRSVHERVTLIPSQTQLPATNTLWGVPEKRRPKEIGNGEGKQLAIGNKYSDTIHHQDM
eukprot:scaffold62233_cov36-Tisochrysis_lutea.AAC.1